MTDFHLMYIWLQTNLFSVYKYILLNKVSVVRFYVVVRSRALLFCFFVFALVEISKCLFKDKKRFILHQKAYI